MAAVARRSPFKGGWATSSSPPLSSFPAAHFLAETGQLLVACLPRNGIPTPESPETMAPVASWGWVGILKAGFIYRMEM